MTSAADRLRPVPAALSTESEVIAALDAIIHGPCSDVRATTATLITSGLLAVSIPAAFGGADISNAVVADAVSRLSAWHEKTADLLVQHLIALELLRTSGTTEQRKAVYSRVVLGDVFERLSQAGDHPLPRLDRSGLSFAIEPFSATDAARAAAWQVLVARAAGIGDVAAIVAADARHDPERTRSNRMSVSPDNVLELGPEAPRLAALMQAFLHGASCRGKCDPGHLEGMNGDAGAASAVEYELLDAIVLKTASVIDGIQVDLRPVSETHIDRLFHALTTACARCSGEITRRQ
ncbi:hypothetical protein [Ciceribacter sp. RN22]|uniref:hypothetical protein n=1 Tax=Ciceribacter sp. RN22 TaxID=2954932 RepID=UPI002093DF66|nr:hypothetical protein [Ciceribacter sp. RN22]MCO6179286.1 hypothetical protein [Ciceribacter sp. RN22]